MCMCFRPPTVQKPIKCPSCGKFNPATNKVCINCKADLTAPEEAPKETTEEKED